MTIAHLQGLSGCSRRRAQPTELGSNDGGGGEGHPKACSFTSGKSREHMVVLLVAIARSDAHSHAELLYVGRFEDADHATCFQGRLASCISLARQRCCLSFIGQLRSEGVWSGLVTDRAVLSPNCCAQLVATFTLAGRVAPRPCADCVWSVKRGYTSCKP